MGVMIRGNRIIVPDIAFYFKNGANFIAPSKEGTSKYRRRQLVIMESRGYTFKTDELRSDNAKKGMGRMKGGTME